MKKLIKPAALRPGDKVAAVSLSWGGAGEAATRWRYFQGKERLEKIFGLEVVEMPHTLSTDSYLHSCPEARAEDLMQAFSDSSVKGIITCIGGEDSARMYPYVDLKVIHDNPKAFVGYSDTTSNHLMCFRAGLSSLYGPSILSDFAENINMPEYTEYWFRKAVFDTSPIGNIPASEAYYDTFLMWKSENRNIQRNTVPNRGYGTVNGRGKVRGRLLGGCLDVLNWLRGTELFPDTEEFKGAILFVETCEDKLSPMQLRYIFRSFGLMGILGMLNGIVMGKPSGEAYYDEYKNELLWVLREFGCESLPVLYDLNFGHTEPKITIPYGTEAEIDCDKCTFSILESGVKAD